MGKKSKTVGLHYEVMNMNRKDAKDAKVFLKDVILMWEKKRLYPDFSIAHFFLCTFASGVIVTLYSSKTGWNLCWNIEVAYHKKDDVRKGLYIEPGLLGMRAMFFCLDCLAKYPLLRMARLFNGKLLVVGMD